MAATNWKKAKTEYVSGNTSYRKLSEKYGIPFGTLRARAKSEGWVAAREQYRHKADTKTMERLTDREADRRARLMDATDKLLGCVEAALEDTERLTADTTALRDISRTIKDIKDIQNLKSDLDRQEQEARIANLRKQAEKDDSDVSEVDVVIEGELEDFCG